MFTQKNVNVSNFLIYCNYLVTKTYTLAYSHTVCLHFQYSNIECVDVILNMVGFPNVNARDKYGRTPLHYAAATAQYQCVLSLVANGASLTSLDQFNRTPLHYAAATDSDAK